ncbi:MAG: arylsulfatase [Rikenellaceae bacterium]
MRKNQLMLTAGASLLAAGSATSCATEVEEAKLPNVIYILCDDLGCADLGCYGQDKFETPNIDAMAEGGVQFMQHYAGCTVSAPSRCSLITGKHTGHTHVRGNRGYKWEDGFDYDTPIPDEEVTLAEIFKQKDYATACIGKWGLGGPHSEGHPNNQGFDYFYGYLGQGHAHHYFPSHLHENQTMVELDGKTQYSHDLIENKALDYIKANKDNPFFIYLTFTLPHAELVLPEEYYEDHIGEYPVETPFVRNGGSYGDQENPHAAFAGMVERLDLSVGRVNALLKELGLDENTLVCFASDNGAHAEGGADPDYFNSTGIYRGIKRDLYEGGIRTPFIAYMPNTIPAGIKNNDISAFWDMMPTLAELIDAESPAESDGISILPAIMGEKQEAHHDYLYWEFHEQGGKKAVRKGDWKLIELQVKNPGKSYYELYNVITDPSETNNVAEANPEIVKEYAEIIAGARTKSSIFKMR